MLKLKQAIIVEGKYDKIKLKGIVNALIIETNGFRIFEDKAKLNLIRKLALTCGVIIMTDSDSAGFLIRNYIRSSINKGKVFNVFIPVVYGREKRKYTYSKEGKLGLEGLNEEQILFAIKRAKIDEKSPEPKMSLEDEITKFDFYKDGLSGREDSKIKRTKLLNLLELPNYINVNSLLTILNMTMNRESYNKIVAKFNKIV
jgi:ribonuclease M5